MRSSVVCVTCVGVCVYRVLFQALLCAIKFHSLFTKAIPSGHYNAITALVFL